MSYSGGSAYTLQEKGFNVFGESLGETLTLPSAEGALAGSYALTHLYSSTTGLLLRDTYPASPGGGALPAETVTHGYETGFDLPDGLGSTLAAYGQQVTYTAFSQVAEEVIGTTTSNASVINSYDENTGALKSTQVENSAVSSIPYDLTSYGYDPAGNITSETDARNGSATETQCFDYDTLDRLTEAWTATDNCNADPASNNGATVGDGISGGAYWTSWAFNPLGDRTTQTAHSLTGGTDSVTTYSYGDSSQPDTLTGTSTSGSSGTSTASYSFDPDGNTLTRDLTSGNQKLTWTDDGKLATDTTSAGTTSYVYDADGNVLLEKDPGQTTLFLFGGAEQLVLDTSTGAITGTRFLALPGGGEVVRTGAGTAYNFELTDQHGTSLLTLDHTAANPAWRQFTPYGAPRGTASTSWPDSNAFLGKPTDTSTGLDLIGARQYDPGTGRFLSVDPVLDTADTQTLGGYTYAADNPVTQADPSGLCFSNGAGYCGGGVGSSHGHKTVSPGPCPGCSTGGSSTVTSPSPGTGVGPLTLPSGYPHAQQILHAYELFLPIYRQDNPYAARILLKFGALEAMCNQSQASEALCGTSLSSRLWSDAEGLGAMAVGLFGMVSTVGGEGEEEGTPSEQAVLERAATQDAAAITAEEDAADTSAARGPSFIAKSNGEVIRVPEGATGPTPVRTGNGFQFTGGSGGTR